MTAQEHPTRARSTRAAILDALEGSAAGLTAAELATALERHPNAIRKQLRALVGDGSVGTEREISGRRGRPAVRYRAAAERRGATANRTLARLLVELVAEGAAAGAATNYAYTSYYQQMAHVHFGLRRLAIDAGQPHGELIEDFRKLVETPVKRA